MTSLELEIDGLRRRYGAVTALDGLTFDVPAGQVFGFLGPNGAGKTTTMRAIFGVTALDAGEIRWRGKPVDAAARRTFGYMPEERGLYPAMTLFDQVEYFALLHGMDGPSAAKAAWQWIDRLGLSGRGRERIDALSHGNQQRAQLAVALVHDPELLVLDGDLRVLDAGLGAPFGAVVLDVLHGGAGDESPGVDEAGEVGGESPAACADECDGGGDADWHAVQHHASRAGRVWRMVRTAGTRSRRSRPRAMRRCCCRAW